MYEDSLLYDEIIRSHKVETFDISIDTYRGSANENSVVKDNRYNCSYHLHFYNDNSFIYRTELSRLKKIVDSENEYQILITGKAGSGKTTLLYHLCKHLQVDRVISCNLFPKEFNNYFLQQDFFNYYNSDSEEPILIDDLDVLEHPNEFVNFLVNAGYKRIIAASRSTLSDIASKHIINLKPLKMEQAYDFLNRILTTNMDNKNIEMIKNSYRHFYFDKSAPLFPRDVIISLPRIINQSGDPSMYSSLLSVSSHFLYQYGRGIQIGPEIIVPERQIITPPKEIITGVTILDSKLLQQVKSDPSIMYRLSPRQFEEMVCDILDAQGYKVELTQQTRDGGKDIIVTQKSSLGDYCIYVECKKYDKNNPVRVKLVRELYGTVMADNATAGLMVTTSYYTKDAQEFRESVRNRIKLKDYQDLVYDISQLP